MHPRSRFHPAALGLFSLTALNASFAQSIASTPAQPSAAAAAEAAIELSPFVVSFRRTTQRMT